jgi:hypothetical protein
MCIAPCSMTVTALLGGGSLAIVVAVPLVL